MRVKQNYDLTKLNTFGISVRANFFVEIHNEDDLKELFVLFSSPEFKNNLPAQRGKKIFLGGGSNVLFTKDFDGIVVLNKLKGIEILDEGSDEVLIRAMSGEVWHDLVLFAVEHGYWGIENLSLIPGTVGAAPMQNIGAYGAELKSILENVETFEVATGKKKIFTKEGCKLGYRDSVFKNQLKDKYFICAITLKLSKIPKPNISYKILKEYLEKNKVKIKSLKNISNAVSEIRRSKLPDPKVIGNAGSFFKNVFVSKGQLNEFLKKYPDIPHFKENKIIKIPTGWFIEKTGWKGKRVGNAGVHDKQALVLVNHGGATGEEIENLALQVMKDVKDKFNIDLSPEVNIIK